MSAKADAVAVLSGERPVVASSEDVESIGFEPEPVAAHADLEGEVGAVLFLNRTTDGRWEEVTAVAARAAPGWQVLGVARSPAGWWRVAAEARRELDTRIRVRGILPAPFAEDVEFVAAVGFARHRQVALSCAGRELARAQVEPHGLFVLATTVPIHAPVEALGL